MLPTAGYFRSIDCPSLTEEGDCKRPYCHFRHSNQSYSASTGDLHLNFKSLVDTDTQNVSCTTDKKPTNEGIHKSVLHGARGAAVKNITKQSGLLKELDYETSTSKPVTDLEYDPLCNFNLKDKRSKYVNNDNLKNHDSSPLIDLTDDGFANHDIVIDCTSSKNENSSDARTDLILNETLEISKETFNRTNLSTKDEPIVISDSDGEKFSSTQHRSTTEADKTADEDQAREVDPPSNITDNEACKRATTKPESLKSRIKLIRKNTKIKPKSSKKSICATESREKLKLESRKRLSRKNSDVSKRKRLKTVTSPVSSGAEIEKYVSRDEIARLDKELNDVGMFDECYRIFQESSTSNDVDKAIGPGPTLQKKQNDLDMKRNKTASPPVREKPRRVAHTMAASSAHNLNRDRKFIKRLLTPQQAMMKRMETIRKEQEELLLSSVLKRQDSMTDVAYEKNKLFSSKHTPSKFVGLKKRSPIENLLRSKSSSKTENKNIFTSISSSSGFSSLKKRKPFENLLSSRSSGTAQATLVKGHRRSAHVSSVNVDDVIEKPRILPDRHSKIPVNIRQRFLNSFIDECLRIFKHDRVQAYDSAKAEEKQCHGRSKSKGIYLSLAASALKKLRAATPGEKGELSEKQETKSSVQTPGPKTSSTSATFKSKSVRIAHGTSPNKAAAIKSSLKPSVKRQTSHNERVVTKSRLCKGGFSLLQREVESTPVGEELYETLCRYLMTEQELCGNGFPRAGDVSGMCKFAVEKPRPNPDRTKKTCARCGKLFVLYRGGHFAIEDECIHHWGKAFSTKVGSHWEKRYNCCQTPIGTEGCTIGETHVHKENTYDCNHYVRTLKKTKENRNPGVYALDCEMAFTVNGLELIRVSVVNFDCQLVYDSLVKPNGKILDYNTRWSGLNEEDLKDVTTTLMDVQAVLLNRFSSDTILIGHSLESDLVALRIVHSSVIDTSVVFPHRLGPPHKRALRNLLAENLGIIIQNAVDEGHDSMEDASACVKLMKWKLSEDLKVHR